MSLIKFARTQGRGLWALSGWVDSDGAQICPKQEDQRLGLHGTKAEGQNSWYWADPTLGCSSRGSICSVYQLHCLGEDMETVSGV